MEVHQNVFYYVCEFVGPVNVHHVEARALFQNFRGNLIRGIFKNPALVEKFLLCENMGCLYFLIFELENINSKSFGRCSCRFEKK